MSSDDPFPISAFPKPVQDAIFNEFDGRCPSIREIASISENHWMKMPGFGPKTIARLQSLTRNLMREPSDLSRLTNNEILSELNCINHEIGKIQDLQNKIKSVMVEIQLRELLQDQGLTEESVILPHQGLRVAVNND